MQQQSNMDCGVFLPIANNGWIVSETSPQYMPTFELNRQVCALSETIGFDFALSMVKFRGYGGKTEYWDYALENMSLIAALAATTTKLKLYASVACPSLHPAMAARAAATISDISGGRFGLNIVSGWNKHEYAQMGMWPSDSFYETRYDYSTEYVQVMRALWETGRTSFKGEYFELDDCFCKPTPVSRVPVVCAGQSDRGMRMAAEVGDYNFVLGSPSLEQLAQVKGRLDAASAVSGRDVGAYVLYGIIADETDQEAIDRANYYLDGTDLAAIAGFGAALESDKGSDKDATSNNRQARASQYKPPTITLPDDEGLAATIQGGCYTLMNLVGSYERIARHIDALKTQAGMAGIIMTFPDFIGDLANFGEHVLPRLKTRRPLEAVR